jgi:hypothetical protein
MRFHVRDAGVSCALFAIVISAVGLRQDVDAASKQHFESTLA